MPKATVHGGASFEPEEESSPGKNSSPSTAKPKSLETKSKADLPSLAPTTEPPSKKTSTASSSARSTAGSGKGKK